MPVSDSQIAAAATQEKVGARRLRTFFALTDQALFSSSSLIVNALLARSLSTAAYGVFAISFLLFLFCAGFHNVLVLEPMSVLGPSSHPNRLKEYVWAQIKIHIPLTLILGVLLVATGCISYLISHDHALPFALFSAGASLPFVLFFWMVRRFYYLKQAPSQAMLSSAAYLVIVLGAMTSFKVLWHLSAFTAFSSMAIAACGASSFFLFRLAVKRSTGPQIEAREVLRDNWNYGRWTLATALLYPISVQIQVFAVAGLLGLDAAGTLRALQLPSVAMMQCIAAIGTLELPALALAFGSGHLEIVRRRGNWITTLLMLVAVVYEIVLMLGNRMIDHFLYAGKFNSDVWLIAAFGLTPILTAFVTGRGIVLRAIRKPQFDLVMNIITAPFGVISAFVFIRLWALRGAVASNVATAIVSTVIVLYFYRKIMCQSRVAIQLVQSPPLMRESTL